MKRMNFFALWLLAIAGPLCLADRPPQPRGHPNPGKGPLKNEWALSGLGNTTGPDPNSTYVQQKVALLAMAGEAARAVAMANNGNSANLASQLSSYVATSPGNAAAAGATNAKGLLIYQPRSSTFDAADFQTFFAAAFADPTVPGIVLSSGGYFVNNQMFSFHINLQCSGRAGDAPFELDFTGVTMFFGNYLIGGIGFFNCKNFYFHGPFNFMYTAAALPFSQGTITAVTNFGNGFASYVVQTDAGYPTTTTGLGDGQSHLMVQYTPQGVIVQNSSDIFSQPATVLNAATGLYQFTANLAPNVQVGNKLAIRGNAGNHGVLIYKGVNFRISYVYIYTAPIFGILDSLSTNSTISNNIIQPWPYTIGSTFPLLSTNADGIHSVGGHSIGPSIVSNQVLSPGDDGIAVHGNYYTVYSVSPSTNSIIVFSPVCGNDFCQFFFVGDPVTIYSTPYNASIGTFAPVPGAFTNLGTAVLSSITLLNTLFAGPPDGTNGGVSVYPQVNYASGFYFNFTFSTFPAGFAQAAKDSLISNVASNGNNFAVKNNAVANHRARSMFIKASNGIVSGNLVQNPTIYGLYISPDLYFLESDFSQNLTVANNYILDTFGPLNQYAQSPSDGSLLITQNFRNITYQGNVFENAGTWATAISSGSNISFIGNLIQNAGCYPFVWGQNTPFIPAGTLSYFAQMSSLKISGNNFASTKNCGATYGNYASPITSVNVTLSS